MKQKSCYSNEILCPKEKNRKQCGHVKLVSTGVSHAAEISPSCSPRYCFASSPAPAPPFFLADFLSVPSVSLSSFSNSTSTHSPTHHSPRVTADVLLTLASLPFLSEPLVSLLSVFVVLSLFLSCLLSVCVFFFSFLFLPLPLRFSLAVYIQI